MPIITVTLNPAIDKTVEVIQLVPGALNKVTATHLDPGGKGINVSKTIAALGGSTLALGLVAGAAGSQLEAMLTSIDLPHELTTIPGQTRTNLKIIETSTGALTEINEPGPMVDEETLTRFLAGYIAHLEAAAKKEIAHLEATAKKEVEEATVVVLSGSLPPGVPKDLYYTMTMLARDRGVSVVLDADGEVLTKGIAALPTAIKPNAAELANYFGTFPADPTAGDYYAAAEHFKALGIPHVFFTCGAQGSYYAGQGGFYRMEAIPVSAHSPVGAGDAFIAAVAYALAKAYDETAMLKLAVATSAGAVETLGTKAPELSWIEDHLDQVVVQKIK